jgi:hypothetical protein
VVNCFGWNKLSQLCRNNYFADTEADDSPGIYTNIKSHVHLSKNKLR